LVKDLDPQPSLFLGKVPLIDVRAPVEFAAGHLPGAVNLPLLNDEERAAVGTEYKLTGQEAAVALGHKLVSGENKARKIAAWRSYVTAHPDSVFYCFRGGMRSQISRSWLAAEGPERPLVIGGYKTARTYLSEQLIAISSRMEFVVVAGTTGSGKTQLISALGPHAVNLEGLANHRGSAFGGYCTPQPSQASFENSLAVELLNQRGPAIVEDESRMIGRVSLPGPMFERMKSSETVLIEEPLEERIENIKREYVDFPAKTASPYPVLRSAIQAISKKLGGARTKEILELMDSRRDHEWIARLLKEYYDPLYEDGLRRRSPRIIFKGRRDSCLNFLMHE
jgi:tRNA 2-selenouridine synthase